MDLPGFILDLGVDEHADQIVPGSRRRASMIGWTISMKFPRPRPSAVPPPVGGGGDATPRSSR